MEITIEKTKKASALIFALITLTTMLIMAMASFETSLINQRTSIDTKKSVSSFQAADSGIELVMQKIKVSDLGQSLEEASLCTVEGKAAYEDSVSLPGRIIKVEYRDADNNGIVSCAAPVSSIRYLRSTGEFGGTIRAVEVSVKP